jgi:hypothetical protein
MVPKNSPAPAWQEAIFQVLKSGGIKQVAYVPMRGIPMRFAG